jgi:hypothetical protein
MFMKFRAGIVLRPGPLLSGQLRIRDGQTRNTRQRSMRSTTDWVSHRDGLSRTGIQSVPAPEPHALLLRVSYVDSYKPPID